MTRTLILVRHAKSDWDDPMLEDHARPLNPRGRDAAGRVGRWLAREGLRPDAALVSSARRTRETWELLSAELDAPPAPQVLDALYHASPAVMLQALRAATAPVVLMLGHNPGIAAFAATLLRRAPPHPRFADYPTCATLVAGFDAPGWSAVGPAGGTAQAFVVPRELPAG